MVEDGKSWLYFNFGKPQMLGENSCHLSPLFVLIKEYVISKEISFLTQGKQRKISENNLKWCQTKVIREVMVAFAETAT